MEFYLPIRFDIINGNQIKFIEVDNMIEELEGIEIVIDINKLSLEEKINYI